MNNKCNERYDQICDVGNARWNMEGMNEDAGYKYLCVLFAVGYYGFRDIIENDWVTDNPHACVGWMQGLEEQAKGVLARCGVHTYNEAMALLPSLKDESSAFLGHGPKYVALGFACGMIALAHCRDTLDWQVAWKVLEGSTHNANAVMDYFGVDSLEACEALMIRLRGEASGFTEPRGLSPNR